MQSVFTFIVFIVLSLAVVFAGHYFVYFSLVNFLKITSITGRGILTAALIILPLSFIISSILGHWRENFATKAFYFLSSLWLGIGVNLILAFIGGWLLVGIFRLIGLEADSRIIGWVAIILALFYSGFGVLNVYRPEIKYLEVKIENLPNSWKGKTAVHISDVHLGHVLGQKFLQDVVDKINSVNPEIVFITGDLFDGMEGSLDFSVQPLDQIKAPKGIYFVTGNHETYFGVQKTYDILKKTKVQILDDQMINVEGLQIIGVSYPERNQHKNIESVIKKIPGYDPSRSSILLWHSPVQIQEAKNSGINLQLSGHTHKGQIFPIGFITRLIYGKYYNDLQEEGYYSIYTSSGVGVWGPTMRTGATPEIVAFRLE